MDGLAMSHRNTLGIDLGSTGVRIAMAERGRGSALFIRAIASRELSDPAAKRAKPDEMIALLIEDLLRELRMKPRECIAALAPPHASVRPIQFPKMSASERRRAAMFEADPSGLSQRKLMVRLHPIDTASQLYALATGDPNALAWRTGTLRKAGLRVLAVDHEGCALQRIFGDRYDAVIDVGYETTRLHAFERGLPLSWICPVGGRQITESIAQEFAIDIQSAERRKRILGMSGADRTALDRCAEALGALLKAARNGVRRCDRIAMLGNGARLAGLAEAVANRANVTIEIPVPDVLRRSKLPEDVLQVSAPEWALAAALATWYAAG